MLFPTTQRSLVLALKSPDPSVRRGGADQLAAVYWIPIYKYVRIKWRKGGEDAEDLTQGFFAKLAEKELLRGFDPSRARLRTYLRRCVDSFATDEARKAGAQKRRLPDSERVAVENAEREIAASAPGDEEPDELFARAWRRQLVAMATESLRAELTRKQKTQHFTVFERLYLADGDPPTHEALATELGISKVDVNNRLSYAKRAFRRLLVQLLRSVTIDEAEYADEARALGID